MEPFFPVDFKLCAAGLTVGAGDTPAPTDLRPSRLAEIMRLQAENARLHQAHEQYVNAQRVLTKNACDWRDAEIAKLRAAYAELEARYVALHALHAAHPAVLVAAAPAFPTNALRHSV